MTLIITHTDRQTFVIVDKIRYQYYNQNIGLENSLQEQEELNRSGATEENNLEDVLDNDLAVENEDVNDNNDKQALISKGDQIS